MECRSGACQLSLLLLVSALVLISCQPLPTGGVIVTENATENVSQEQQVAAPAKNITLQSGFEIPPGIVPSRQPAYDDVITIPAGSAYRSNVAGPGEMEFKTVVRNTTASFGDGFKVEYRADIETGAGQFRYNIISTRKALLMADSYIVNLRLADKPTGIQVENVGGGGVAWNQIVLQIRIPAQTPAGDYGIDLLYFIDGAYRASLPCTIHVAN